MDSNSGVMMKYFLACVVFSLFCFGSQPKNWATAFKQEDEIDSIHQSPFVRHGIYAADFKLNTIVERDYGIERRQLLNWRDSVGQLFQKAHSDSAKGYFLNLASDHFTETFLNNIIPHWYGTDWDYNGYTDEPGTGLIACGYFVSTTLKHSGFNLNRFRLAQAYSLKAVIVLEPESYLNLNGKSIQDVIEYLMTNEKDGLFVVGLDNHIGYLVKRNGGLFFLHASYMEPVAVVLEKALAAGAIQGHENYLIARISNNATLIKAWLANAEIKVP